ncbi:MAG: hypothetical protein A3E01_01565 [Gammaproteobacteria bacterium RIFCSPHIGHO2_12_FULL_63_22]|nr:MAG: hypothetical protein A3E01_01565 [Gammaproteobacteria bacterium RIFCSPHIGHO2_12_FULL_63_22]
MNRRDFLTTVNTALAAAWVRPVAGASAGKPLPYPPPMPSAALDASVSLTRIALGSCYVPQFEKADVWNSVSRQDPQLFLYMGDNVYQSEENGRPQLRELRDAYTALAADRPFAALRARTPIMVTWDDHDYGMNNAGAEFPARLESEALFKHVWAVAPGNARAERSGVYYREQIGPEGQCTQVIMLDTRYFRTAQTMLGDEQWRWLEQVLSEPADLRLLVSSIPVLMEAADGEGWRRWPKERERLFKLIGESGTGNLVILSGDSHFGAYYRNDAAAPWPLYELTASSLNFPMPEKAWAAARQPDPARLGEPYFPANFGMVLVDWEAREVALCLQDASGQRVRGETLALPLSKPKP